MAARTTRRGALRVFGALVATGVLATVTVGVFSTAAGGIGPVDDLLTTTTTLLGGDVDSVVGGIDGDSSTTTTTTSSTTTTSTTTAPTTTTTARATATTTTAPPTVTRQGRSKRAQAPTGTAGGSDTRTGSRDPSLPAEASTSSPLQRDADLPTGTMTPDELPVSDRALTDLGRELAPAALPAGGRSTRGVLDKLAGLSLPPSVVARILAPFPVAGPAYYSDDWQAIRSTPTLHFHEGTDIFAARGTPVIASADGVITRLVEESPIGGNALRLTTTADTYFYYAHLDAFAPRLAQGDRVTRGDVLGFVGTSGNAEGTSPHLHYEIHPGGGEPVNPVTYLDRWLIEAELSARSVQAAPESVAAALAVGPRTEVAAAGTGRGAVGLGSAGTSAEEAASQRRAPGAVQLGPVQPISSVAARPLGLLLLIGGARVGWKRAMRRRRARRREVALK